MALRYLDMARKDPKLKNANAVYEKAMYLNFFPARKGKKGKPRNSYASKNAVASDGG